MCDLVIHDAHKVKVVECSPLSPVLDKVLEGDIDDVVNELENGKSLVNVVPIAWPGSQSTLLSMVTQSDFPSGRIQELIVSLLNRGMLSGVFYGLDGQSVTRLESNVINHSLVLQLSLRGLLKKGAGNEERATIESLFTQGIQFHMVKEDIDIIAKEVDRIAAEKSSQRWRDLKDILLDRSPRSLFHLCRHDIMRHLSTVSGAKLKPFDLQEVSAQLPLPPIVQRSLSFHCDDYVCEIQGLTYLPRLPPAYQHRDMYIVFGMP
ncbi:hypothetical protein CAPTEDRAFT_220588 [Capitella teleta]|uniref:SOCS box domain-containing protein n=1 Tax=Capitella teleta TaxID=283909 RepID=R7V7A9_CAPTE|nr:hypothetical protein CAPTEDRAFT_220588 [Capitella teleta]|eukprot:ELU14347.1 hypothetical protein CAPTEDRAFT_220588 [Capitella teleta]